MNINQLIAIIKKKLTTEIDIQEIKIEDKSFLHKNHKGHKEGKWGLLCRRSSLRLSAGVV